MKILLVGSFWRGSFAEGYRKAFSRHGCAVELFDINAFFPNNSGKKLTVARRILNRILWKVRACRLNNALVKKAIELNPEIIFVVKGREIHPSSLKEIKRWNTGLLFNFNSDDFFPPRFTENSSRWLRESIPLYHCLFSYKTYALRRELIERGAQRVELVDLSYDADVHRPVTLSPEEREKYSADVVFVGSPEKERIQYLTRIAEAGYGLKVYGGTSDWAKQNLSSALRRCIVGHPAFDEELCKIYAGAKIVLTFFRRGDRDITNNRIFEVPATGAFMLVERNDETLRFFDEGKEVECFDGADELLRKIGNYLVHDKERNKIAEEGHRRAVSSGYDFEGGAKKIIDIYRSMWAQKSIIS